MNKIVLCSTQRSGSTMVVEDMRNSEVLGNPEEYFIKWQGFGDNVDINNEIDSLFKLGSKSNIFSVKLMANQVKKVNSLLNRSGGYKNIVDLFSGASWIYIKRNDTVKQAISRYIASVTKVNHAIDDESSNHFAGNLLKGGYAEYNTEVPYDFNKIFQEYCNVKKENLFWQEFFLRQGVEPLVLEYEVYSQYRGYEHVKQIADHAGILEEPKIVERKLKKLSNKVNKRFVDLFKDEIFGRYF